MLKDDQNSVVALYNEASPSTSAPVERYEYSAYGRTKILDGNGVVKKFDHDKKAPTPDIPQIQSDFYNPFGFQGMWRDEHTGLYHTHYRILNPNHARWLTPDPKGYVDGQNLYRFYGGPNGVDLLGDRKLTKAEEVIFKEAEKEAKKIKIVRLSVAEDKKKWKLSAKQYKKELGKLKLDAVASIKDFKKHLESSSHKVDSIGDKALLHALKIYSDPKKAQEYALGSFSPRHANKKKQKVVQFEKGSYKCNKFVAEAYYIGADLPLKLDKNIKSSTKKGISGYPSQHAYGKFAFEVPLAASMAKGSVDKKKWFGSFKMIDMSKAEYGDILAWSVYKKGSSGHVGLYLSKDLVISAKGDGGIRITNVARECLDATLKARTTKYRKYVK